MAPTFELPADLRERVAVLASDLNSLANEAQDLFDEQPEGWRENTDGWAAEAWIEALGDLARTLEDIPVRPE